MKDKVIRYLKNSVLILSILIYFFLVFYKNNQYIYSMSYVKSIIFICLICFVLFFYGLVQDNEKTYKANVWCYIFLYFVLLTSITFIIGRPRLKFYNWTYYGNYQLFYTIKSQLKYGSFYSIMKNVVGNSIMMIPLSLLLMIKNKKFNNIFRQLYIILPIVVCIEYLQAYTHTGSFDIDDILLNYLFTVIFTFLITRFSIMDKLRNIFYTDYIKNKQIKNILFYISIFILLSYISLLIFKII